MAIRKLIYALAATAMATGVTAQAASPAPARLGTPVQEAEQLGGNTELIAVLVGMAAILSILVFDGDSDGDEPVSP